MKQFLRHLLLAPLALAAGMAVASCGAEAASELELAQLDAELRGVGELAPVTLEVGGTSEPDPLGDCDCGDLMPWPPPECPRERWFCNKAGECGCDRPPAGSLLLGVVAPPAAELTLRANRTAPDSGRSLASTPVVVTHAARVVAPLQQEPSDFPLRDPSGDPECKCLGASVSPPQGGCSLADWFCNASGLCRCRS